MQKKKISHPCGCCELAYGRIIRWGKKPWADTNIKILLVRRRHPACFFLHCLDPNDLTGDRLIRSLPRSFELIPISRRSIRDTAYDTLRLTVELVTNTTGTILLQPLTA